MDDCGGGYSESIAEMCEELQNGSLPLLMATPNGRGDAGASRDAFLLNPTANTPLHLNCFRFLGQYHHHHHHITRKTLTLRLHNRRL